MVAHLAEELDGLDAHREEAWNELAATIDMQTARRSEDVSPGVPPRPESPDTTHFSVIDAEGNVVATTTTLNFSFGSAIAVPGAGFLLNNEMDDFVSKPGVPNAFGLLGDEANAIAAGKRPLSSMTPTIVLLTDGEDRNSQIDPGVAAGLAAAAGAGCASCANAMRQKVVVNSLMLLLSTFISNAIPIPWSSDQARSARYPETQPL